METLILLFDIWLVLLSVWVIVVLHSLDIFTTPFLFSIGAGVVLMSSVHLLGTILQFLIPDLSATYFELALRGTMMAGIVLIIIGLRVK